MSAFFKVSNGVRQGGVLSPKLFAVYVNDLSLNLAKCKVGCFIDNVCFNHVFYADDLCILAPSAIALQKLLDISYSFGIENDIIYNPRKSVCMVFRPNRYSLSCPSVYLNDEKLSYETNIKYLGVLINEKMKDDEDILRQVRLLYTRANSLIRFFARCYNTINFTCLGHIVQIYTVPIYG